MRRGRIEVESTKKKTEKEESGIERHRGKRRSEANEVKRRSVRVRAKETRGNGGRSAQPGARGKERVERSSS